ncbi:cyclic nucleotide-gated ion channel 1-like isoform X2 [Quercus robur]|uniref:cyclic nucleotide-gated ion channel 1-like isoform X2 n=1 Tax=Quercus robur TaxID=38942 RepID=UPI00216155F9|nr:cyclic nucleotide-gated ion channel 1-like isoform X2 [Quercus robur]
MTTPSQSDQTPGNDASNDHKKLVNIVLVSLRAIALALDPLFFFVPVIHEDKKCISEDKTMWINAIFWRSVLDFIYLVHFVMHFPNTCNQKGRDEGVSNNAVIVQGTNAPNTDSGPKDETSAKRQRHPLMCFMFDIIVILPIPQVLMTNALSEMRRAKYTDNVTILNIVLLIQYVPRVLQIYLSLKELEEFKNIPILIRASFNFFLFLLGGHVAGAFWYFFSTQRLISCWRKACLHQGGCIQGSFNCDHRFGNLSALHDFCSIDSKNTSTFDFGIFLEARQSGILESTDFPKKLIYSAWWGVRNLSSYGSNLQTSTYIWENIFALGISIFGLLLFLYLLGNLQRRASKYVEKSEEGKNSPLNKDVVDKILEELGQLYKERLATKSSESPKKRWCCCC